MCGASVAQGFLCAKCDKPRKPSGAEPGRSRDTSSEPSFVDEYPQSAISSLPMDNATSAITSVTNVLVAAGAPAVVIAADRTIKFVTDDLRKLFSATQTDLSTLAQVERLASIKIGNLNASATWTLPVRNLVGTLVPFAGGAVLVFRAVEASADDAAMRGRLPRVTDVVRSVVDRFIPFAELKGIRLQIDARDMDERFREHGQLGDALGILMDNSLHYVPPGGQVVAGVRMMEHKGKPLLLFFVMDSGPLVPDHLRQVILEPGFVWNPAIHERTGRGLSKVRDFATRHGGSVWTESRSGKACTFFLRVRPDGVR